MELETLFCLRHLAVMGLKLLDLPSQLLHVLDGVSQYRRLAIFVMKGTNDHKIMNLSFSFSRRWCSTNMWLALSSLAIELGVRSDGLGRTLVGVLGVEVRDH